MSVICQGCSCDTRGDHRDWCPTLGPAARRVNPFDLQKAFYLTFNRQLDLSVRGHINSMAASLERERLTKVLAKLPGRKTAWTNGAIRKIPCIRCGSPSYASWQICSDGRLHRPICVECDIDLNRVILQWLGLLDWESRFEKYAEAARADAANKQVLMDKESSNG